MPRRNLMIILAMAGISLACYHKASCNLTVIYFNDAMSKIQNRFLFIQHVSQREMADEAISGVLKVINQVDRYTEFQKPKEAVEFREKSIDQQIIGIGVVITVDKKTNLPKVLETTANSPAENVGIEKGDLILRVDGQDAKITDEFTMDDCSAIIKGHKGEPVVITILREGEKDPLEFKIIRDIIKLKSVSGDQRITKTKWNYQLAKHPKITFIRLDSFGSRSVDELKKALEQAKTANGGKIEALIFDLRFNGGGLLQAAIRICDMFIDEGVIVSTKDRYHRLRSTSNATSENTYPDFPIVILINKHSASASELVAACLQDHQRALIVGSRSYGKGTVQNMIKLVDGERTLKLTTSYYIRPNGKNIHKLLAPSDRPNQWGVSPNPGYNLKLKAEELIELGHHLKNNQQRIGKNNKKETPFVDRQLEKAAEYLDEKIAK